MKKGIFGPHSWRLLPGMAVLAVVFPASAAYVRLNVSSDNGLVNAFATANANPTNYYDVYLSARTYRPSTRLNLTRGRMRLNGDRSNPGRMVLDGQNARTVVQVWGESQSANRPSLEMNGVLIRNGMGTDAAGVVGGGGVRVIYGDAYLSYCIIRKNQANLWGSGIFAQEATLDLYHVLVDSNTNTQFQTCGGGMTSSGGGVGVANGYTYITNSAIVGNKACRGAGLNVGGTGYVRVENTTISGNEAKRRGGGVFQQGGSNDLIMRFNTITNNTAGTGGSGTELAYGAGLGLWSFQGTTQFYGNILAKNTMVSSSNPGGYRGNDCYAEGGNTLFNPIYNDNIVGIVDNCSFYLGAAGSWGIGWSGAPWDPLLDALALRGSNDGFQTPVHMPQSGSTAIAMYQADGTLDGGCPYYDQREFRRPNAMSSGICDIGAAEVGGVP